MKTQNYYQCFILSQCNWYQNACRRGSKFNVQINENSKAILWVKGFSSQADKLIGLCEPGHIWWCPYEDKVWRGMMKGLCNDYGKVFQQYVFNHIYTWVVTRYPGGMTYASCARYATLRVTHAPAMTFSPPPLVSDPDIHHGTCVTHVPWCIPGSLTSYFLWSRRRGKRSRRMYKCDATFIVGTLVHFYTLTNYHPEYELNTTVNTFVLYRIRSIFCH